MELETAEGKVKWRWRSPHQKGCAGGDRHNDAQGSSKSQSPFLRQNMNTTRQQQTGLFVPGSFGLGKSVRSRKGNIRNRKETTSKQKLIIHILSRNFWNGSLLFIWCWKLTSNTSHELVVIGFLKSGTKAWLCEVDCKVWNLTPFYRL